MKKLLYLVLICLPTFLHGQIVYEPVTDNLVYELLDELAALQVITINSAIKPYSRIYIANKLNQALEDEQKLNKRQLEEVRFYLKDYSFEGGLSNNLINGMLNAGYGIRDTGLAGRSAESCILHHASFNLNPISFRLSTAPLRLTIAPQFGTRFMINENGTFFEASGGGEAYGYLTKHIGYYISVTHIHQCEPLVNPVMLTMEEGKSWNYLNDGSVTNTEWRGGISVGWKWGDFGIYKDRPVWGNANHGSNILSGHPPSFPYIQLHLKPAKWMEFYSITGFLQSNVVDSNRSTFTTGSDDIAFRRKYFSTNFFTITPWKGLDVSIGNSIFWSDMFKVGYLIPFNLYKSVDQTLKGTFGYHSGVNTNDDGHMFLDISSRNIKHLHLYLGWWIDDWVTSYFFDQKLHNAFGWKLGASLYDLPIQNLTLTIEGSINRPRIYHEYIPADTYANDDYNFGNYLRDDSWELFILVQYKPKRGLEFGLSYNIAQKGSFRYNVDDYTTYPISKDLIFNQTTISFNSSYQITSNLFASVTYMLNKHSGDTKMMPALIHGNTNTFIASLSLGF